MYMFFHWNFNSWFPQVFPNFFLYRVLVIFGPKMKIFGYIIQQNQKYTTSKTGVRTAQSPIEQKLWPFFGFRQILRFFIFYADSQNNLKRARRPGNSWLYFILMKLNLQYHACLLTHHNVLFKSVLGFWLILLPFFFLEKKNTAAIYRFFVGAKFFTIL